MKPIRIFFSPMTRRLMASRAYKEISPGVIEITGEAFDVTNDIAELIERHELTFTRRAEPVEIEVPWTDEV